MGDISTSEATPFLQAVLRGLDKVDARFDRVEERIDARFDQVGQRFDELGHEVADVRERVVRIEAADPAGQLADAREEISDLKSRVVRLETLFLPITGLASAVLSAGVAYFFSNH